MSMTDAERAVWLEERKSYVTASDVAAIVGRNKYVSRSKVLAEKVSGDVKNLDGIATVESGQFLEEGIFKWFVHGQQRALTGRAIVTGSLNNDLVKSVVCPVLAATPDGIIEYQTAERTVRRGVEIKNVGFMKAWQAKASDDFNVPVRAMLHDRSGYNTTTAFAPEYYVVQLMVQLHCLNLDEGFIVACVGGQSRVECLYRRNREWESTVLIPAVERFWAEVLEGRNG